MKCRINHIGYLTQNIAKTCKAFEFLGYYADIIVNDDVQKTRICFLHKEGETSIELVEPYQNNDTLNRMISLSGHTPYHICYEVDDIDACYEEMLDNDFLPLFKPVEAPAFGYKKICYFSKKSLGLIELVNKN